MKLWFACIAVAVLSQSVGPGPGILPAGQPGILGHAPVVCVRLEVRENGLPPQFRADPAALPEITARLHTAAVDRFQRRFPFLIWRSGTVPEQVADVTLTLDGHHGIGWSVSVSSSARVEEAPCALDLPQPTLYAPDEFLPAPATLVEETVRRGEQALTRLIEGAADGWQQQWIRRIPLARDVHVLEPNQRLVLPLAAGGLQAGRESVLEVLFLGRVPDEDEVDGFLKLKPSGQVHEAASPWAGMQKCRVIFFEYEPDAAEGWHQRIPQVLKHRRPESLRIHMHHYIFEGDVRARDL